MIESQVFSVSKYILAYRKRDWAIIHVVQDKKKDADKLLHQISFIFLLR